MTANQFIRILATVTLIDQRNAALAVRLKNPANRLSMVPNLLLVGTIIVVQYRMLAPVRLSGYIGMLALVTAGVSP